LADERTCRGIAREAFAALASPSDEPCRTASDDRVSRNITGHNGPSTDHGESTDAQWSDKRGQRADRDASFHNGSVPVRRSRKRSARAPNVRKLRSRADEHVFPEFHPIPNARMALNSRSGADYRAARDKAERPDDHVGTEGGPIGNR
jgi:hypothetical protein